MPVDWSKYPKDWKQIALQVKEEANWTCQECGRPCRRPDETWHDFVVYGLTILSPWYEQTSGEDKDGNTVEKPQRFTLTVAHLDHDESNCSRGNLKAMCSGCHLKYDAQHHAKNAASTRRLKKERQGQLALEGL